MHSTIIPTTTATLLLASTALAQTVQWTSIPNICRPACAYAINLSQGCARNPNDAYLSCVCQKPQSPSWIPGCEACVAAYWDADNDVKSLLDACSFTTTTWTGVATATGSETAAATGAAAATTTTATTGGSASGVTASAAASSSGEGTPAASGTPVSTPSSTAGATPSEFTGAAAPFATAGVGLVALLAGLPVVL